MPPGPIQWSPADIRPILGMKPAFLEAFLGNKRPSQTTDEIAANSCGIDGQTSRQSPEQLDGGGVLRSVIHSLIIALFILGGLICVAADAWQTRALSRQPAPLILGWILLLLGAAAALTMVLSLRRQSRNLVDDIHQMTETS